MQKFIFVVTAILGCIGAAQAQVKTAEELDKVNGGEWVRLCALPENSFACEASIVLRVLDHVVSVAPRAGKICTYYNRSKARPRVVSWLKSQPALLTKPSAEGVTAAMEALYPASMPLDACKS